MTETLKEFPAIESGTFVREPEPDPLLSALREIGQLRKRDFLGRLQKLYDLAAASLGGRATTSITLTMGPEGFLWQYYVGVDTGTEFRVLGQGTVAQAALDEAIKHKNER